MGKFRQQLSQPLSSVSDRPWHFSVWCFVAVILGSAGFWLPILFVWLDGGAVKEKLAILVYAGTLASFSVVLLADGIAATLTAVGAGSNNTAAGMRGFFGCVALLIAFIHMGGLTFAHSTSKVSPAWVIFQLAITVAAIVLASYLYCFRFPYWERDVAEVKEEEEKEVNNLSASAQAKAADDAGVKL
jgi:hypothetical protein